MSYAAIATVGAGIGLFGLQGVMAAGARNLRRRGGPEAGARLQRAGAQMLHLTNRLITCAELGVAALPIFLAITAKWGGIQSSFIPLPQGLKAFSSAIVCTAGAMGVVTLATAGDALHEAYKGDTTLFGSYSRTLRHFDEYAPQVAAIGLALAGGWLLTQKNLAGLAFVATGVGGAVAFRSAETLTGRY